MNLKYVLGTIKKPEFRRKPGDFYPCKKSKGWKKKYTWQKKAEKIFMIGMLYMQGKHAPPSSSHPSIHSSIGGVLTANQFSFLILLLGGRQVDLYVFIIYHLMHHLIWMCITAYPIALVKQHEQTFSVDNKRNEQPWIYLIIIIAFKGAIRDFFNLLTAPRTVSNMYTQVARVQSCANHVQHIERLSRASVMLRATWYEGTAQLLSLTELKSHLCELYFIGWTIKLMKDFIFTFSFTRNSSKSMAPLLSWSNWWNMSLIVALSKSVIPNSITPFRNSLKSRDRLPSSSIILNFLREEKRKYTNVKCVNSHTHCFVFKQKKKFCSCDAYHMLCLFFTHKTQHTVWILSIHATKNTLWISSIHITWHNVTVVHSNNTWHTVWLVLFL